MGEKAKITCGLCGKLLRENPYIMQRKQVCSACYEANFHQSWRELDTLSGRPVVTSRAERHRCDGCGQQFRAKALEYGLCFICRAASGLDDD